jgi:hypothetical protein
MPQFGSRKSKDATDSTDFTDLYILLIRGIRGIRGVFAFLFSLKLTGCRRFKQIVESPNRLENFN